MAPEFAGLRNKVSAGALLVQGGDAGYEEARAGRCFGSRVADRFPAAICLCKTVSDVQACVQFAEAHALKLSVRSGGHNWFSCSLRSRSLLVDVGDLQHVQIDKARGRAVVGPGVGGGALQAALQEQDLFFPTGHCYTTPIGGFLLGGGYGLGQERYGLSCESIVGLQVVTPEGRILECGEAGGGDASEEGERFLWMARGGYTAVKGVITSFTLRTFPKPHVLSVSSLFPVAAYAKMASWIMGIKGDDEVDSSDVEVALVHVKAPAQIAATTGDSKMVILGISVFADTPEQAHQGASLFSSPPCTPIGGLGAPEPSTPLMQVEGRKASYPLDARYSVDAVTMMWEDLRVAPLESILEQVGSEFERAEMGRDAAHMLTVFLDHAKFSKINGPMGTPPGMLILCYSIYDAAAEDAERDEMIRRILSPLSSLTLRPLITEGSAIIGKRAIRDAFPEQWEGLTSTSADLDPKNVFEGLAVAVQSE